MGRPLGSKNNIKEVIILPDMDRNKPHAEVCGLPGAAFEQNGKFFNKDGHYVPEENCRPVNDTPDPPQPEEYTGYNQVIYQESPKASPKEVKEKSIHIIYGDNN